MSDLRRHAPATERNRDPILAILQRLQPARGTVLEIASGTGEHIVHFARSLPKLAWQPSDPDAEARASIDAWADALQLPNLRPAIDLDAAAPIWPIARADAILCINMIHISPWAATIGLMAGAARLLPAGAPFFLYGPYRREGVPTAPSNEGFDQSLKARDPRWGLRDLEEVVAEARGFALEQVIEMPANNLSVILRRA